MEITSRMFDYKKEGVVKEKGSGVIDEKRNWGCRQRSRVMGLGDRWRKKPNTGSEQSFIGSGEATIKGYRGSKESQKDAQCYNLRGKLDWSQAF